MHIGRFTSLLNSFIYSTILRFIDLSVQLSIHPYIHWLIYLSIHSLINSVVHVLPPLADRMFWRSGWPASVPGFIWSPSSAQMTSTASCLWRAKGTRPWSAPGGRWWRWQTITARWGQRSDLWLMNYSVRAGHKKKPFFVCVCFYELRWLGCARTLDCWTTWETATNCWKWCRKAWANIWRPSADLSQGEFCLCWQPGYESQLANTYV